MSAFRFRTIEPTSKPGKVDQFELFGAPVSEEPLFRIAVCGSREFRHKRYLYAAMDEIVKDKRKVAIGTGEQRGADQMARNWAIDRGHKLYPAFAANWDRFGYSAGPRRNGEILRVVRPNLVVAFWSEGPGTADMISQAKAKGIPVLMAGGSQDDCMRFERLEGADEID